MTELGKKLQMDPPLVRILHEKQNVQKFIKKIMKESIYAVVLTYDSMFGTSKVRGENGITNGYWITEGIS
jgi:hypothetical protein